MGNPLVFTEDLARSNPRLLSEAVLGNNELCRPTSHDS